ncbi:MAG: Solute carrier 2 (Facilitated glucose transporter) member 8 [Bathelium mastoideum]|nr:MAG: Solute carrier 2 (Facilitated glucose transporter) member 8 [Bathelium mastoideum]
MQSSQQFKYTTLPGQDEGAEDGEADALSRSPTSITTSEIRQIRGWKVGTMFELKPTKPWRPPPHLRDGDIRLPNERYVYLLTGFVSLGALLFGYDQGVMGVIVADARWQELMRPKNSWITGAVISLFDLGCLLGALFLGTLADRLGRERTLALGALTCLVGAICQAAASSLPPLLAGRIVLGIGVGACSGGAPLYIAEIAPAGLRGRVVALEQMVLCFGELVAFWADYGFARLQSPDWWRIPLAAQVLPAAVLAAGCWWAVPPSPRWLVAQGRREDAREVLTRLHGSVRAGAELAEMEAEQRWERRASVDVGWLSMFRPPALRVTMLGMGVQFFQQITGTNSILYYAPTLFENGGIRDPSTRNLATGGVGIVLFATSWIPIFVFDRLGRRTWLQVGTLGMMISMLGITVLQSHAERHPGDPANFTIVAFPYLFYVFFNISWGVGSWTYAAEIFPLSMRAKGSALSTMSLWGACYVVAQASPVVVDKIGWGLYIIYAAICVGAFVFVRYAMVETKGRSLEEMSRIFGIEDKLVERRGVDVREEEGGNEDLTIRRTEQAKHTGSGR